LAQKKARSFSGLGCLIIFGVAEMNYSIYFTPISAIGAFSTIGFSFGLPETLGAVDSLG
jgi:hypothetical protein